ncbi:MAG: ATP-binding protein [Patescibacteria group bacterium]
MNAVAYSCIITIIFTFVLGFVVYFGQRKNRLNQIWLLVSIFISLWIIGLLGSVVSGNSNQALFWQRLLYIGTALIPATFFHYSVVLVKKIEKYKRVVIELYSLATVFVVLSFTTLFIVRVIERTYFNYWPVETGIVYPIFLFYFATVSFFSLRLIYKEYKITDGLRSKQLLYMFVASLIGFIGGSTNFVLDFNLNIYPIGNFFVSFYAIIMAYAIIKYRLMDIRFIISRSLLYLVLVSMVTAFFTALSYLIALFFENSNTLLVTFIISLFIVVSIGPLKNYIGKITDKIFYRGRIDYQQLLLMLSEVISLEIDLENLTRAVTGTLTKELKLKDSILFLPNKTGGGFTAVADKEKEIGTRITKNHPILAYLKKYRDLIVVEEMEREIADMKEGRDRKKRELIMYRLEDLGASICVPVFVEGELKTILVLGKKMSGDIFNNEDLNLLELFAPQLGTAIEKAKLYKEVSDFNIKLRDEVKKATNNLRETNLELQSRNSFLENLQRITNLITRTLNFKSVTRDIVNSISDELGYVGGILLLVDKDKDKIYIEAYSQSQLAKKAVSLLPKPIKEYESILSKATTLSSKVVKTGQIQTSKAFADFVAPPVPRQVANLIQKLMGIQTTVGVPIYSEDRVVGVIVFLIDKDEEKVSDMDFSMMNALANQTGIVFKNLELVNEIQKTNKQLQVANSHLKQLDEAKSEFMSIASHQLRTPLAGIMGYLSMLQEGDFGAMTSDQNKVIADVFDGSRRLIRMVNLFLNVTRIEAGRFKLNRTKVDIVKVIQSEVKELRPTTSKKKLKLNFIVPKEKIPMLNVDEDKIKDVVLNLVDNAIKYTEKGGITVTVQKKDENVLIIVKDTGVGINPTDAEKLFSKFVRGSGISRLSPDGSGLGLFIARKIVDAHKGKIWAESEGEGKGSAFNVELPIK